MFLVLALFPPIWTENSGLTSSGGMDGYSLEGYIVGSRYYVPCYNADTHIMRSVVDPDFLPPGGK